MKSKEFLKIIPSILGAKLFTWILEKIFLRIDEAQFKSRLLLCCCESLFTFTTGKSKKKFRETNKMLIKLCAPRKLRRIAGKNGSCMSFYLRHKFLISRNWYMMNSRKYAIVNDVKAFNSDSNSSLCTTITIVPSIALRNSILRNLRTNASRFATYVRKMIISHNQNIYFQAKVFVGKT